MAEAVSLEELFGEGEADGSISLDELFGKPKVTEEAAPHQLFRPVKIPVQETRDVLTRKRDIGKGASITPITSPAQDVFDNSSGAAAFATRVQQSRKQRELQEQGEAGEMASRESEWLPTSPGNLSLRETPGALAARKVGVDRPALSKVGDVFAATAPIKRPIIAALSGRSTKQQLGKEYLEAEEASKQRKFKQSKKPEELKAMAQGAKDKLGRGEEITEEEARAVEADKSFMDSLREMAVFVKNNPGEFGKELGLAFLNDADSFLIGIGSVKGLSTAYKAARATGRSAAAARRLGEGSAAAQRFERAEETRRGVEATRKALVKPGLGQVAKDIALEEGIVPTAVGASKEASAGREYTRAAAVQDVLLSLPFSIPHLSKLKGKQPLTAKEWDNIARVVRRQDLEKHPRIAEILPALQELAQNKEFTGRISVTAAPRSISKEEAGRAYGKEYAESFGKGVQRFQVAGETGRRVTRAEEAAGAVPKGEARIFGRGGAADVVEEAAHLAEQRLSRLAQTDEKMGMLQSQISAWAKHARAEAKANGLDLPNDREILAQAYAVSKGHGKEYPEIIRFLQMPESIRKKFDALVLAREADEAREPKKLMEPEPTVSMQRVDEIFSNAEAEARKLGSPDLSFAAPLPATHKSPEGFVQMSIESQPGESIDYLPGIHSADLSKRTEYHGAIIKSITNEKTGKNAILESYGIPEARRIDAPGAWKRKTNPGSQYLIPVEGLDEAGIADLETRIGMAANDLRKVLRQEAVAYHRPVFQSADVAQQNGIQVDVGRTLTPEESQAFYDKIIELTGRDDLAPIAWAGGARVLNFPEYSGIDNATFHRYIQEAAEASLPMDHSYDPFTSKGDLVGETEGAKYEQRYMATPGRSGSPDLQRGIYADYFQRATKAGEEFGKRYGWANPAAPPAKSALSLKPDHEIFNPIPRGKSPEEKADALLRLAHVTRPKVDPVLKRIDEALGTKSISDIKKKETILEKTQRPITKQKKPWMDVEHVRDVLRFKTAVQAFEDIPKALETLLKETGADIIKLDVERMRMSSPNGHRAVMVDLRMPNGLISEYQLLVRETDEVSEAAHHVYEKLRVADVGENASPEALTEFEDLMRQSRDLHDAAWERAIARLGLDATAAEASLKNLETSVGSVTARKYSSSEVKGTPPRRQDPASRVTSMPGAETTTPSPSRSLETRTLGGAETGADIGLPSTKSIQQRGPGVKEKPPGEERLFSLKPVDEAGAPEGNKNEAKRAQKLWEKEGVNSPYFKRWFGDSKVLDEKGKPKTVYHGTARDFSNFTLEFKGEGGGFTDEEAFFFSEKPNIAGQYATLSAINNGAKAFREIGGRPGQYAHGDNIMPVFLKMENPLRSEAVEYRHKNMVRLIQKAKKNGHDGLIFFSKDIGGFQEQYAVFNPTQIKSATGNRGTFDPESPNIAYSLKPDEKLAEPTKSERKNRVFYSGLTRAIEKKMSPAASPEAIRGLLRGAGTKEDEIKWTGLDDFLAGKEKVTKAELLKHLEENAVEVREVLKKERPEGGDYTVDVNDDGIFVYDVDGSRELGGPFESVEDAERWAEKKFGADETKYNRGNLIIPGGKNYRELLLTFPNKKTADRWVVHNGDGRPIRGYYTEAEARASLAKFEEYEHLPSKYRGGFESGHFKEPNILAHVRFNERKTPDGKKVLFLEEVQSDWHQKGRKEGYVKDTKGWTAKLLSSPDAGFTHWQINDANGNLITKIVGGDKESAIRKAAEGIPDAPFKKTWHELALRRMLRWAAENGFDRLAWTTGEQQAARYDLSQQLQKVVASKNTPISALISAYTPDGKVAFTRRVPIDELENTVGKDLAKKISDQPVDDNDFTYSGLDLKVGGEGMKTFYDKMLPQYLDKYGKKWGAKVEPVNLHSGSKSRNEDFNDVFGPGAVQSIPITESMRKSVVEEGQPLFSIKPDYGEAPAAKEANEEPPKYKVGPEAVKMRLPKNPATLGPAISYEAGPGEVKSGFITPAEKLYTEGVNEAYPLEQIQNKFEKEQKGPVRPEQSIKFAVNQVLGSGGAARIFMQKNLKPIIQGGEVDGFKYTRMTPDEARDMDAFALARDALWRYNKGKGYDNPVLTREHAQRLLDAHKALPEERRTKVENAANGLVRYAKVLARRKMGMGLWDEVQFSQVTKNPYYIPEIRDFEKVASGAIGKAKKDAFSSTNKLLRGTFASDLDAPVFDPITALIHDTAELETEAAKMRVWNRAIDLAEKDKNLAGWIRRLPDGYTPAASEGVVQVLRNRTVTVTSEQMTKAMAYDKALWFVKNQEAMEKDDNLLRQEHQSIYKRINALPQEKKSRLGGSMESILERVAKNRADWKVRRLAEAEETIKEFKKLPPKERLLLQDWIDQGKPQSYLVPKEVADAVKGMAPMEWAFWQKPMVAAASVFRRMTVGWNPDFSFSNVPRDAQEAYYNVGLKPWQSLKGLYHYLKKDEVYDTFMKHGGAMEGDVSGFKPATSISQEIRYGDRFFRDRYKKVMDKAPWEERKVTAFGKEMNIGQLARAAEAARQTVKMPFEVAESIGEAGEMLTRLGVMDMVLKNKKLTPEEGVALARTATLDFRRIGSKMKSANAMIPFLNARIQGFDRLIRTAKQDPAGAATRAFISAAVPATALLAWNMQNPNYQDIPAWEKEYYWILMKGKDGEEYFKVAKGFLAQLVVNPIQMTVENLAGTAKKDWWKIGLSVLKSGLPVDDVGSTINPLAKLPLELKSNYDFYFDRDIVKEPGKTPYSQYDQGTAETMKTIGEALNYSPAKLQHIAKTLLGGTSTNILFALDYALGKTGAQPERKIEVEYAPFVKRVFGVTKDWKSDLAQKQRGLIRTIKLKKETYGKGFGGDLDIERGAFMKQIRAAEAEGPEAGVREAKRVDKESEDLLKEIDKLEQDLAKVEEAISKTTKLQSQLLKKASAKPEAKGGGGVVP